jgi:ligand-binding sensor domain-containing protein
MLPSNPPNTSGTARLMVDAPGFAVGWQQPLYLPAPAAGQPWVHTVDGRYFERLISATFSITTDVVAGSRFPLLRLFDSNGKLAAMSSIGALVAASSSMLVSMNVRSQPFAIAGSGETAGLIPDLLVPPGWTWSACQTDIDVGDQVSGAVLIVQQFPSDAVAIPVNG